MLKRFFIVFISVCFLGACDSTKKPKNLISKKDMVNILIDAKLIASASGVSRKAMEEKGIYPNSYIFEKYNIDSTQFAESNLYYTYKVKDYEEIYTMVKDSLDKLKEYLKTIQEKERKEAAEKKRKDSLEAVLKTRDSLKLTIENDSISNKKLNDSLLLSTDIEKLEIEKEIKLIEPVSDK